MKFIVIRTNLKDGISVIDRVGGVNLNLPILKNTLIEVSNNKIKLTATDLEIAINYFVSGKIIENGSVTVPISVLSSVINNIQSDRLNIEKKSGNKLLIKTDNYEAVIHGSPIDDFPITPKIDESNGYLETKSDLLKEAINQVLVSTQFSDLRPELNSVLFNFDLENLKLAATDSFRLSEKRINKDKLGTNRNNGFRIMVPLKTASELSRSLREDETVRIYNNENQILFKTNQFELLSRLIEGNFPDYEAIIPKKFDAEIIINKQELTNAIKLAGIFGSKNHEIKIVPRDGKKVIEIKSSDQALGENNYILSAKVDGSFKETIFNWRYIMDVLKVLNGEEVQFSINNDGNPAQIKDSGDGSYFYILKPISEV
ncbi:MAG: DNA polymerase III subunit beta [Patescibacteria group bacterium]